MTNKERETDSRSDYNDGNTHVVANNATLEPASRVRKFHIPMGEPGPSFLVVFTMLGIAVHLILRYFTAAPRIVWQSPLIAVLAVGGILLVVPLARKAWAREFGSDHLAGISIITAAAMGEYLVGAIVILMLSGGTALERFASRRASSALDALARRMPQVAHRREADDVREIRLGDIHPGDTIVILPHEICPVDGTVIEGRGKMNEAYLTGEPFEMAKTPGAEVLSGAVNGDAALVIRAEKLPVDSHYARIMQVMQMTQERRPQLRRLGDKLGAWFTPLALALAGLAWILTGEAHRFLGVLVVATPCPLLIGIPVAVIGSISLCARQGIIVKNPAILEQVDQCRTIVFDKTGTLTYGRPSLSKILCAEGIEKEQVLKFAASLERYSRHPLASAIVQDAERAGLPAEQVTEISERPGEGLRGIVSGTPVWITGRGKIAKQNVYLPPAASGLECLVFLNGSYAATFRFEDQPREESLLFVRHLKPRHAVNRILIVSGDREREVRQLAEQVGIENIYAAKSPEEKVQIVLAEAKNAPTLFLGDGINDAPAMQAATVGVAFGAKNDITSEAADAVIMEASLGRMDDLLHLGRRMRRIALQTAVGGMALSLVGMVAAAAGLLAPIEGAILQELIDLAAVLNAVRAALPPRAGRDFK